MYICCAPLHSDIVPDFIQLINNQIDERNAAGKINTQDPVSIITIEQQVGVHEPEYTKSVWNASMYTYALKHMKDCANCIIYVA